jgi:pimeloyl-ACP methyl ester carboxylesterase
VNWQPRHVWIEHGGVRLHALEDGPPGGPLVLLLHGFPEFSGAWRHQAPALARAGFHVVALDQRGYALSDKPSNASAYSIDTLAADVLAAADAYGAARCHVAGHDWGGAVAWWLAIQTPERIARAAILNAPHPAAFARLIRRSPRQVLRSAYMLVFQVPWLPEWLASRNGMQAAVDALRGSSRPGTFDDAAIEAYRDAWRQPGAWTGMINWYRAAFRRPPLVRGSTRTGVPVLLLWGDQDRFLDSRLASESVAYCADGRLVRLPRATHWLQHEAPDIVNRELLTFFSAR